MKNLTMYDISNKYIELSNIVENLEGELTIETEYELAINEGERDDKSLAYYDRINMWQSFLDNQVDVEIERLTDIKRRKQKAIDILKANLLNAVELFGDFEVGLVKFSTRISEQVICEDVNLLPKEFKTTKVTETANKKEIKKALKLGQEIKNTYIRQVNNLKIN
jgi:hypothetical protein